MKMKKFTGITNYTEIAVGEVGGSYVSVRTEFYDVYIGTQDVLTDPNQCILLRREEGFTKLFLNEGEKLYGKSASSAIYVIYHNPEPTSQTQTPPINLTGTIQLNQQ